MGAGRSSAPTVLAANMVRRTRSSRLWVALAGLPPAILSQPQSQTVAAGQSATFGVSAVGSDPLSYQWTFGGVDIAGGTGTNYFIASAQWTNMGSYAVRVSNAAGSTNSFGATLT